MPKPILHRLKWWALKVFCPWVYYRELAQETITDALHPDFGWIWRDEEIGGQSVRAAREEGQRQMLESIRSSLRDYPNIGGDIEVMKEVDRIIYREAEAARTGMCQEMIGRLNKILGDGD
jgi:hypothetical protein